MSKINKPVTSGQIECFRKMLREKRIESSDFQRSLDNGKIARFIDTLKSKANTVSAFTTPIPGAESLELKETDGKATIAKAKDIFPGWIDSGFKGYGCDVESQPTEKMQVAVHEMIKDGTFVQIFGGMSDDFNSLCLTQPQIIQFVQKYHKWLRTDGYATFFLFKVEDDFFVADVFFGDDGQLEVSVSRFSDGHVWHAECRRRIVFPQLTLGS